MNHIKDEKQWIRARRIDNAIDAAIALLAGGILGALAAWLALPVIRLFL